MFEINYLKKLKHVSISYKISIPTMLVLGLIFLLVKMFLPLYWKICLLWLENHIQLALYGVILLIFSLIFSWIYLLNKIKQFKNQTKQLETQIFNLKQELENKLFLEFGIYWDKKFNPYCPICEKPLSRTAESEQKYYSDAYCHNCDKPIPIFNDEGQLTISEAQKILKKLGKYKINHNQ